MRRWAELTSFLVGATAALVLLAGWRVPSGHGLVGADVTLSAALSPTVTLSQTGPFANAVGLTAEAGQAVAGSVYAHNATGRPLAVRIRLRADVPDLDRALVVDLRAGGTTIYNGRLGGVSRWTRRSFLLGRDESSRVTVRGRLRRETERQYESRIVVATLELRGEEPS
jgi:hypothetical protein